MTRTGTIPLSDIASIQIYQGRVKNNKSGLKSVLKETGGTFVMGGPIFLRALKPCCHLKADGNVLYCPPNYNAWAISWDTPANFAVRVAPNDKANYMACVKCIINGKKVAMDYQPDMKYPCNRLAVGVKNGGFAYYATTDNLSPENLQDRLFAAGWQDAIMLDGGGSACWLDENEDGFAGDGRVMPFYIVVTLRKKDTEPEGEKTMVEINAYSLKADGEKKLTAHFKVKEFRCKDGSDTILIARELPVICEYLRMRTGKPFAPNSAYRTPQYNKQVGGVENSQHTYGTAVDIPTLSGYTPAKMAAIAREIMPDWGGVGIYSWGIHVDVRKEKADW